MKSNTPDRIEAISTLIKTYKIGDQKKLVQLLRTQYDIDTNQTQVSRDLQKLHVIKKRVGSSFFYELPEQDAIEEILKLAIIDIAYNEATIVITTQPALADFVGDRVDACKDLDLLGCVSGENTVFIAPKSTALIHATYITLCQRLHFKIKDQSDE